MIVIRTGVQVVCLMAKYCSTPFLKLEKENIEI